MAKAPPNLFVSTSGQTAWIKVIGRASFASSVAFKTLVQELKNRDYSRFILELAECVTMDSTFLGVLSGLALRYLEETSAETPVRMDLAHPNQRILDLLENLGVAHLFRVVNGLRAENAEAIPVQPEDVSRDELSRTVLEAHQTLMEVNPQNIPKFKDVAQFLAEDLRREPDDRGGSGSSN